jgi:glucosamine kinase
MSYFLGLDGGGTKTAAVLVDDAGRVVAEVRGNASNPLRSSFAHAFTSLDDASARALAAVQVEASEVFGVTAGIAGASHPRVARRFVAFLSTRFRQASVEAITDLEIGLETVAEEGPAMVLLAGTGSAAFGRDGQGRTSRAGGWGPWFSDEGSAFDIGRRTLAAIAHAHDAATPPDGLEQAVGAALGIHDWQQLIDQVSRKPLDRLPTVFPAVAAAAEAGNETARGVLLEAAESLAALANIVIQRLGLGNDEFALGRVGGVFGRAACLDQRVEERLRSLTPGVRFAPARFSPAVAAARRALRRATPSSTAPADPEQET